MELKMEHLTKRFGETAAVDGVSFAMKNGIYGLLGVNGAGKTTLMRMICTLLRPTEGKITCGGKEIFMMDQQYRKLLGYLPQDFGFYPDFTLQDYLLYIASIKGLPPAAARKRVNELMDGVGLMKARNQKMKKFSGGMKRRAGIAQAMLNDPKILILDEPTAGLDPNERIRFRNLISELSEDRLVLLSTHIVSDVEYIAGEILLMNGGKIMLSGTADEITASISGKVYSCVADRKEADAYLKKYKVANVKKEAGRIQLRILADEKPCPDAVAEKPGLEDAFLFYFGEKAGEGDGAF